MKSPRNGFILLELLVGLMLTAFLLQGLCPLLATSFAASRTLDGRLQSHQTARMAMEEMTHELRMAKAIESPLPNQPAQEIRFKTTESDGSLRSVSFHLGGGDSRTLYRTRAPGQPTPVTQNVVTGLEFQVRSPQLVHISLTVTDPASQASVKLQDSVVCLNTPD